MFDTPVFALTAAGGNSRAARSMRARLQWRDRFGRWIEMGRGVKFKVRGADGSARSVIGSFVGAVDDKTGQVYVSRDPNGLPDGFYDVKSSNAQEFVANLDESQLAERGIELGKDASGNDVGQRVAEDIPNITEMKVKGAPEGWIAQKGTFGGKKVIETDDGDFRVHFAGKDDTVLLEDHRATPGQADQQRSMAEAFKKVSDVDIQREESGDAAYTGLTGDNDEKLAGRSRDEKIDQIKGNERTLANERANLGAKQSAMTANETLKKELADEGQPYDPEGADSDEAHEARKAAPAAEAAPDATQASTGAIDTSTFDVAPEGFLVPTGKQTNDISPQGLATFMSTEKEQLSKGGSRLVVDTDANTAEIHNSADTLEDAKAQAGGLGVNRVLDLASGSEVQTAEGEVVDPNSPDVNPNLSGDTSPEAPNAENSNPDAVEPGRNDAGADAPASNQPDGTDQRPADAPDAGGPAGADDSGADSSDRPAGNTAAPGSVEELQQRRAKVQAALDNAGDPKDIIALNEQADALDTRIAAQSAPDRYLGSGEIVGEDPEILQARRDLETAQAKRDKLVDEGGAQWRLNNAQAELDDAEKKLYDDLGVERRDTPNPLGTGGGLKSDRHEDVVRPKLDLDDAEAALKRATARDDTPKSRLDNLRLKRDQAQARYDNARGAGPVEVPADAVAPEGYMEQDGETVRKVSPEAQRAQRELDIAVAEYRRASRQDSSPRIMKQHEADIKAAGDKLYGELGEPRPENDYLLDRILGPASAPGGEAAPDAPETEALTPETDAPEVEAPDVDAPEGGTPEVEDAVPAEAAKRLKSDRHPDVVLPKLELDDAVRSLKAAIARDDSSKSRLGWLSLKRDQAQARYDNARGAGPVEVPADPEVPEGYTMHEGELSRKVSPEAQRAQRALDVAMAEYTRNSRQDASPRIMESSRDDVREAADRLESLGETIPEDNPLINSILGRDKQPEPQAETPERPNAGDIGNRMTENERSREEALRLLNESEGDPLALSDEDYKRLEALATEQERKQDVLENTLERLQNDVIPSLEKDYENLRAQLDEANGVQELDFDADRSAPESSESPAAPEGDIEARQADLAEKIEDLERQQSDAERRLNANTVEGDDDALQAEVDRLFDELADAQDQYLDLESRNNGAEVDREQVDMAEADLREIDETAVAEGRANREEISGPWAENPLKPTRSEIAAAPVGAIVAEEHDETGNVRLYRKREDGRWDSLGLTTGPKEPTGYTTTGHSLSNQGSNFHYVSDMDGSYPVDPEVQRRRDEQMARIEQPEGGLTTAEREEAERIELANDADEQAYEEARTRDEAVERPAYVEPGDADAVATARQKISELDTAIENEEATAAQFENAGDYQRQAESLARIRTMERDRRTQENALNRALGNRPMDLNGELGWNMNRPENRGSLPEAPEAPEAPAVPEDAPEAPEDVPAALDPDLTPEENPSISLNEAISALPEDNRTPEERLVDAETEVAAAERNYVDVLSQPDYSEEDYERALDRRDYARDERDRLIEARDYEDAGQMEEREMNAQAEADYGPNRGWDNLNQEISDNITAIDETDPEEGGGIFAPGDSPLDVRSGHESRVAAAKARVQGKELSDDERAVINEALDSGMLSDNQLSRLEEALDARPNRSNTTTMARPEQEQPEYMSTADMEIVNAEREDPNFVYDEDLVWRKVQEEFPGAETLDNGDLVLDETENKGKKYQTVLRRTNQNRYMVYVMETDQNGNRRAKRIGNTEWHSYEALETRIAQGRALIHGKSPAGSIARRKDQPTENLGTMSFPADDFLGDFANPDADLPATGDPKFDRLLQTAAQHIRDADANLEDIETHLQQLDEGAAAIQTIMNAIVGRAQRMYRPDTAKPYQLYDGETAEVGDSVDWTDWHQELDWWTTTADGRRVENPDKRPNPRYGQVTRGVVTGYVAENSDGKGHTYGDHVWVQLYDAEGRRVGNRRKMAAQNLRKAEPGSPTGIPFFSKREEWRSDPEMLARHFRVPFAEPGEPVTTQERPRGERLNSRELSFTPRGSLSGYSNIPVPSAPSEIGGMIAREEVTPSMKSVTDLRSGMMIQRMDDEGNQFVDTIIRVDNLGDGGFRIHAARPTGTGTAKVDSFVVPEDMDVVSFSAPAPKPPTPRAAKGTGGYRPAPQGTYTGKTVEFVYEGSEGNGVVIREEADGSMLIDSADGTLITLPPTDVVQLSRTGAASAIRADLLEMLEDTDVPSDVRRMILAKLFSPRTTSAMIGELTAMVRRFDPKTPQSRVLDSIFGILKVAPTVQNKIRAALREDN